MFSVLCPTDRSHAPHPVHEPALLPLDSVEEAFLVDVGSYDEVGVANLLVQCILFKSSLWISELTAVT